MNKMFLTIVFLFVFASLAIAAPIPNEELPIYKFEELNLPSTNGLTDENYQKASRIEQKRMYDVKEREILRGNRSKQKSALQEWYDIVNVKVNGKDYWRCTTAEKIYVWKETVTHDEEWGTTRSSTRILVDNPNYISKEEVEKSAFLVAIHKDDQFGWFTVVQK